jgi:glucose-1-phosphate adenylyltransferase
MTIAVQPVPWEEASRLGIITTDATGKVVDFAEKPEKPKSSLASMGIYVFKWDILKYYLIADEQDENSSNDFGKNVIPKMLGDGVQLYAHSFGSYWKDVGTIESLWQSNMDLLEKPLKLDLYNDNRRIYCRNSVRPPHYVAEGAKITNSLIPEGCIIYGDVSQSVLFPGVFVGKGSTITNSVVFKNAIIGSDCHIDKAVISDNVVIEDRCVINGPEKPGMGSGSGYVGDKYVSDYCSGGISIIASEVRLGGGVRIPPNSMVEEDIREASL